MYLKQHIVLVKKYKANVADSNIHMVDLKYPMYAYKWHNFFWLMSVLLAPRFCRIKYVFT